MSPLSSDFRSKSTISRNLPLTDFPVKRTLAGDTRGFRRLRAGTTKCQSLNERYYFISLSLSSLPFLSFFPSFHFFLQLFSLSLFLSPFRRCSAYLYEKYHSTIEHAYPPPEVRGALFEISFFFFFPPSFFNSLKAFRCFLLLRLFLSVFVRSIGFVRYIYMYVRMYMYIRLFRTFSSSAFENSAGNVQFVFMNG